ncbi:MAG: HD domain-containing protein [Clostridia bacterium]|nr:HD domain-containing protein [Clostridia bacterium]
MITFDDIRTDPLIRAFIQRGDDVMSAIKYTEHGFAHAGMAAERASRLLAQLGYDARTLELARIAGFMHDIGNSVNRHDHAQSSAVLAYSILSQKGMEPDELCEIISAIGHHDEGTGGPVSPISAALILADKSDVRRSRVRSSQTIDNDIHDRVNYAVISSELAVDAAARLIVLSLEIDMEISAVMDYFEIFLSRMLLCRKAAEYLGLKFELHINNTKLL